MNVRVRFIVALDASRATVTVWAHAKMQTSSSAHAEKPNHHHHNQHKSGNPGESSTFITHLHEPPAVSP